MPTEAVRVTNPRLLQSLFKFRYKIYVEQQKYNPPSADHVHKEFRDAIDDWSVSFAIVDGTDVVGSLRIAHFEDCPNKDFLLQRFDMHSAVKRFGEKAIGISSRFIVDTSRGDAMRRMLDLMKLGYEYECQNNRRLVFGDCSPQLLGFYRHIGYRAYAAPFFDETFGIKLPIVLINRDKALLKYVRSPLKRFAKGLSDDCAAREWFTQQYAYQERRVLAKYM